MGQQDVYDLLKKHKNKWLSSKEIAKRLKASSGSVITSLKKLREGRIISFKLEKRIANKKVYVYRFRK